MIGNNADILIAKAQTNGKASSTDFRNNCSIVEKQARKKGQMTEVTTHVAFSDGRVEGSMSRIEMI